MFVSIEQFSETFCIRCYSRLCGIKILPGCLIYNFHFIIMHTYTHLSIYKIWSLKLI